jgi:DNA adenine methylase
MIRTLVPKEYAGRWVEPFMGTGCVGFNLAKGGALMADSNPHLINFYSAISDGSLTPGEVREFLTVEGSKLSRLGEKHFYDVRERFNATGQPLDFLFLNRSCFNGMIRFNKSGKFNVPFCRKPERFARAYVTKITNQVANISMIIKNGDFEFAMQNFRDTIAAAKAGDLIYCDPPYIDRHVDYFNGWSEADERDLKDALAGTKASFILSTWSHNTYRDNVFLSSLWNNFPHITREHFYYVGANIENRRGVTEALVYSSDLAPVRLDEQDTVIDEGDPEPLVLDF